MKICGAPIEIPTTLFHWKLFQKHADLLNMKPHNEKFVQIKNELNGSVANKLISIVWERIKNDLPENVDWIIKYKYLGWVCFLSDPDSNHDYPAHILRKVDFETTGKKALRSCMAAETEFVDSIVKNNPAYQKIFDELFAPSWELSSYISAHLCE
jgi:hypothetical protein